MTISGLGAAADQNEKPPCQWTAGGRTKGMDDYQKEQLDAFLMIRKHLNQMDAGAHKALLDRIAPYLAYRRQVDVFFKTHFAVTCSRLCFENRKSACCSKEGIVTFFADTVVNVLCSSDDGISAICQKLRTENTGFKCIYLGPAGCMWQVKPIVCEMFLCDPALDQVFGNAPVLKEQWEAFRRQEGDFKWPDKPVLFDDLEKIFITAGCRSSLMYLHNSPGLLRVKKQSPHYPETGLSP